MNLKHEFSLSLSTVTKWNRSKFILTIHQPTSVKEKKFFSKNKIFDFFFRVFFYFFSPYLDIFLYYYIIDIKQNKNDVSCRRC
jgi:hypothetical protein